MVIEQDNFTDFNGEEELKRIDPSVLPPIQEEERPKEEMTVQKPSAFRKIFLILVILFVLALTAGASFYIYHMVVKANPLDLLPADTSFYIRIKINQEDEQFKNFTSLLNKFPNYDKLEKSFVEKFNEIKNDYPIIEEIKDFNIFEEAIFVSLRPIKNLKDLEEESPFLVILANPDLSKINKIIDDIKYFIERSENTYQLEEEKYQGRTIFMAASKQPAHYYTYKPEFSFALVNSQFVISSEASDIKKIIDVAETKKITKIFAEDKAESITSTAAYKKVSKYLPKEYLVFIYSQQDWSDIFNVAEEINLVQSSESLFNKLIASSLGSLLDLSFLGLGQEKSEKIISALAIVADEGGLTVESCSLDLRENAWQTNQFFLNEALVQDMPEKIKGNELVFYTEASDLKNTWDQTEEIFEEYLEDLDETQKEYLDEALWQLEKFEESLSLDFREDFISQLTKNYSAFLYTDPSGEKEPVAGLIFALEDESEIKDNLLKIEIPKGFLDSYSYTGSQLILPEEEIEKITFSRELIDLVEVYSMPLFEEYGLNFTVRNNKLIFSLTKQAVADITNAYLDFGQTKLLNSKDFSEEFEKAPQDVISLSYIYPYGFVGLVKNVINNHIGDYIGLFYYQPNEEELEGIKNQMNTFVDKGIAPYLKTLKRTSAYSYSPEPGLVMAKERLTIKEPTSKEKSDAEEFWKELFD